MRKGRGKRDGKSSNNERTGTNTVGYDYDVGYSTHRWGGVVQLLQLQKTRENRAAGNQQKPHGSGERATQQLNIDAKATRLCGRAQIQEVQRGDDERAIEKEPTGLPRWRWWRWW